MTVGETQIYGVTTIIRYLQRLSDDKQETNNHFFDCALEYFERNIVHLIVKMNTNFCKNKNLENAEYNKLYKEMLSNMKGFNAMYQEFEKSEVNALDFLVFTCLSSCMASDVQKQMKQFKSLAARWKKLSADKKLENLLANHIKKIL